MPRRPTRLVSAAFAAVLLAFAARADLGEPDRAFGDSGLAASADSGVACGLCAFTPLAAERLPDGKLLVAVSYATDWFHRWGYLGSGAAVARLNADGTPDATFGVAGVYQPATTNQYETLRKLARLPDGRLLLAGTHHGSPSSIPYTAGTYLARTTPDGAPDPTFGTQGVLHPATSSSMRDVAVLPDGRVLLLLADQLWRLLEDGSPDPTFGAGGMVALPSAGQLVIPRPDARVLVVWAPDPSTGDVASRVRGLMPDGGPDTSFGETPLALAATWARLDANGRLLVGGVRPALQGAALTRVLADGGIDAGFGEAGLAAKPHIAGFTDVALLPDGRILAAASIAGGFRLARFLADGAGDASLRATSEVDLEIHPHWGGAKLVPLADGGVLVAGALQLPRQVAFQASVESRLALAKAGGFTLDLFGDSRAFAAQQYRDFLGREGDDAGIAHWAGRIDAGTSRAAVAESFLLSPEFEAVIAPVARLYFAYFDRLPDLPGLKFYAGYLRGSGTLASISNTFAGSAEFLATYGWLTHEQFVDLVYRNVLGRAPDAAGFAYWKARLDGQMPRGEVMLAFSESPEYRAATAGEVRVLMGYFGMLRRLPDAAGFDFWVGQAEAGASLQGLVQGFLDSDEYRARFVP